MLPTLEEQNNKFNQLLELNLAFYSSNNRMLTSVVTREYAKWYAIEIIKHCADMVTLAQDETILLDLINEL